MSFFTKELLRAVNIPVFTSTGNIGKTLHTTPFFRTLGYTMSHGDDMYDRANQATPVFPGEWLLITNQNFDYWFNGPGQLGPNGSSNVGRQADYDVPIKSLSDDLVQRYCADKQSNATHDNGTVAAFFYDNVYGVTIYTVQQLEGMNLWDQLGTKAAAMGLCTP
jgi:hypothetical protein